MHFKSIVKKAVGAVVTVVTAPVKVVTKAIETVTHPGDTAEEIAKGAKAAVTATGVVIEMGAKVASDVHNGALNITIGIANDLGGNVAGDLVKTVTDPERLTTDWAITVVRYSGRILEGKDVREILAGPLAAALRSAREQYKPEARPIPSSVSDILKPYYDARILAKARYTVGVLRISLPGACNTTIKALHELNKVDKDWFQSSDNAVTADNIIIFSTDPGRNVAWWAHELQHVVQFDTMGVDTFAFKYAKDFGKELEGDANKKMNQIVANIGNKSN